MVRGGRQVKARTPTSTITSPTQKLGTAMKTVTTTRVTWSPAERRHTALAMPTGMPMIQDSTTAMSAIWAVMGPRRRIRSRIGSPRQNDRPRSPRRTSPIQSRYWRW